MLGVLVFRRSGAEWTTLRVSKFLEANFKHSMSLGIQVPSQKVIGGTVM